MTTDEQYVPSEGAVKLAWAARRLFLDSMGEGDPQPDDIYNAEFDRFLARVRRDAAREALDGMAKHATALAEGGNVGSFRSHWWTVAGLAEGYRDAHYPEETP